MHLKQYSELLNTASFIELAYLGVRIFYTLFGPAKFLIGAFCKSFWTHFPVIILSEAHLVCRIVTTSKLLLATDVHTPNSM